MNGADDAAEMRFVNLMTLLRSLIEVFDLFVNLEIKVCRFGFSSHAVNDNAYTDNHNNESDKSYPLYLTHKETAYYKSRDCDDKTDNRIRRNQRCCEIS